MNRILSALLMVSVSRVLVTRFGHTQSMDHLCKRVKDQFESSKPGREKGPETLSVPRVSGPNAGPIILLAVSAQRLTVCQSDPHSILCGSVLDR